MAAGLGSHVTGLIHNNKGEISLASSRYLGVPDFWLTQKKIPLCFMGNPRLTISVPHIQWNIPPYSALSFLDTLSRSSSLSAR